MAIHWHRWGDAASARARAEAKPILLSLTATWCHACHRMDDETWDDPGVAAAVERCTVPVRVDADERPDLYGRYHLGGLPTTALLTADGEFVRGGTFLSPAEFLRFLDLSLADWRAGHVPAPRAPGPIVTSADVVSELPGEAHPHGERPVRQVSGRAPTGTTSASLVDETIAKLGRRFDAQHGGFGLAPKVPETHALTLVLRRWRSARDVRLERMARASLDAIAALADPRDGGFFRYAAAPDWTAPHTEKLALDQASISELLLEAGTALDEARYVELALASLDHVRRRLATDHGRVLSSVAADPDYYGSTADPGSAAYHRSAVDGAPDRMPAIDHRRFADASAAVTRAAALALAVTGVDLGFRPEYREQSSAGSIPHRLDAPGPLRGVLRDQALGLAAAVTEYRLTGRRELLEWAASAADWSVRHLWDEEASAFRASRVIADEPSLAPMFPLLANGEMALALLDLADHASDASHRERAGRVIGALRARAARFPAGAALAVAALRLEEMPAEADLRGEPGNPAAEALARAAVAALGPSTIVRWSGDGGPELTLCSGSLCLPPVQDPRDLLESLADVELVPRGILARWSTSIRQREGPGEEAS